MPNLLNQILDGLRNICEVRKVSINVNPIKKKGRIVQININGNTCVSTVIKISDNCIIINQPSATLSLEVLNKDNRLFVLLDGKTVPVDLFILDTKDNNFDGLAYVIYKMIKDGINPFMNHFSHDIYKYNKQSVNFYFFKKHDGTIGFEYEGKSYLCYSRNNDLYIKYENIELLASDLLPGCISIPDIPSWIENNRALFKKNLMRLTVSDKDFPEHSLLSNRYGDLLERDSNGSVDHYKYENADVFSGFIESPSEIEQFVIIKDKENNIIYFEPDIYARYNEDTKTLEYTNGDKSVRFTNLNVDFNRLLTILDTLNSAVRNNLDLFVGFILSHREELFVDREEVINIPLNISSFNGNIDIHQGGEVNYFSSNCEIDFSICKIPNAVKGKEIEYIVCYKEPDKCQVSLQYKNGVLTDVTDDYYYSKPAGIQEDSREFYEWFYNCIIKYSKKKNGVSRNRVSKIDITN